MLSSGGQGRYRGIDRVRRAKSDPNAASCEDVTTWKPNVTSGASCCRSCFRAARGEFKRFRRTGPRAEILGLPCLGAGARDRAGGRGLRIKSHGRPPIVQGCPCVARARGFGAMRGVQALSAMRCNLLLLMN